MSYTDFDFPHTSLYQSDLREILAQMENLKEIVNNFVNTEKLTFADPILWNIATQYSKNTIVLSPSGDAYLSKQAVPTGVQLNNEDYWQEIFNFADYVRTANENLTINVEQNTTRSEHAYHVDDWLLWDDVLYKVIAEIAVDDLLVVDTNVDHFTVEDFIKAWITYANGIIQQYKNDIDASELAYRQQLAQDIANTTASLQAQLNLAISGATVDSEVINARLGADGVTYPTLGDAIRTQITDCNNLTVQSDAVLKGSELKNYFTGTDDFTNSTTTDTRDHLFLQIVEFMDNTLVNIRKQVHIQETGLHTIFFTTTPVSAPFNKIKLYHNGNQRNIDITEFALSENSKKFALSVFVDGYDPTILNGIDLKSFKCFEYDVTLDDLKDTATNFAQLNADIAETNDFIKEESSVLNGEPLIDLWSGSDSFKNTITDTRDHLFMIIQEYNGATPVNIRKQIHIQETGLHTILFDTTPAAFPFDTLKIYHNGSYQNIDIASIPLNINSTRFALTFFVNGYNPTTTNGINLKDFKLYQINTTLLDLKDTNRRLAVLEGDNEYKFVNSDPIYASAHDHTSANIGEMVNLNGATINIVGDSMVANQVTNKQSDPSFVTISDYIHLKYPNAAIHLWGEGGSTIAVNPNSASPNESFYERIAGVAPYHPVTREADVWVVWGGYNDVLMDVETPLGDNGSTDTSTLYGAMREIVYNIQDRVNCPRVVLVTPHYAYGIQRYQTGGIERLHNLRECFYEISDELSCVVCDLFKNAGLNNRNGIFTHTDALHLNQNGYYYVYPLIMKAIENLYN